MAFDTRLLSNLNVLAAVVQAGNFARAGKNPRFESAGG